MKVLLVTTNAGKIKELARLLQPAQLDLVGLDDSAGTDSVETGTTFVENALLKARHYQNLRGVTAIADDSGLEVDALGGAPGVHSARFGGPGLSDRQRTDVLLEALKDVPHEKRSARFVCVAAIAWNGRQRTFTGKTEGVILFEPRGQGGFGYDPVFFYPPLEKSFAELTLEQKTSVSHRGKAFRQLVAWLREGGLA